MSHPDYPAPAEAGLPQEPSAAQEQEHPAKKSNKKWASLAGRLRLGAEPFGEAS